MNLILPTITYACRDLTPQRDESPQPIFAQVQTSPDEETYVDWKKRMAEPWIADADMARYRPAQISREQDGTKYRRARNQIESNTTQQNNADAGGEAHGISQLPERLNRRRWQWLDQFESSVYQQEQHNQPA